MMPLWQAAGAEEVEALDVVLETLTTLLVDWTGALVVDCPMTDVVDAEMLLLTYVLLLVDDAATLLLEFVVPGMPWIPATPPTFPAAGDCGSLLK